MMNDIFEQEKLDFFLPKSFKSLTKEYILACIFDEDIQKNWKPSVGDIIVGCTGNVFVISGHQHLIEDLGGDLFLFGGSLCSRDGGSFMNSTQCYAMNRKGIKFRNLDTYNVSKFSDYRYVPYPHENNKFEHLIR